MSEVNVLPPYKHTTCLNCDMDNALVTDLTVNDGKTLRICGRNKSSHLTKF